MKGFLAIFLLVATITGAIYFYQNAGKSEPEIVVAVKNPADHADNPALQPNSEEASTAPPAQSTKVAKAVSQDSEPQHAPQTSSFVASVNENSQVEEGSFLRDQSVRDAKVLEMQSQKNRFTRYLADLTENPEWNWQDAMAISSLCARRFEIDMEAWNSMIEMHNFGTRCDEFEADGRIFDRLEAMAEAGNETLRLNYWHILNIAVAAKIIDPAKTPYDYARRRDMGLTWLQQYAEAGLIAAVWALVEAYHNGELLAPNPAYSYYYAAMLVELGGDAGAAYQSVLPNLRSNLTEAEQDWADDAIAAWKERRG